MALIPYPFTGGVAARSSFTHTSLEIKLVDVSKTTSFITQASSLGVRSNGVIAQLNPAPVNTSLTIYINGSTEIVRARTYGVLNLSTLASVPSQVKVNSYGDFTVALYFSSSSSLIRVNSFSDFYLGVTTGVSVASTISWSDIGHLDFTEGRDNVAGHRPLDWRGYVYSIVKFRGKVIVYGAGGVSFLNPVGNTYGLETFYRVGLKGKRAACGDETKQFFIDTDGRLWKLGDSLELLDYSEYLNSLNSNLVMSYDKVNNLVYICDVNNGYVYDVVMSSLGKGQVGITAVEYQAGVKYIGAASTIETPVFEICTDIYDFGIRSSKTIYWLEFGTDLTNALYAAVDYRRSKASDFVTTPWYLVPANGRVHIRAYGTEFRFRAKLLTYQYFELDYIKINGVTDDY